MRERIEGEHTEMLFKAPQGREIDFGRQLTSLANCAAVLCVSLHVCARAPVCVCVCTDVYIACNAQRGTDQAAQCYKHVITMQQQQ